MFHADAARSGGFDDPVLGGTSWEFKVNARIGSSPAVVGGFVYFGSRDGTVHAVEATTGTETWTFKTGGDAAPSPAVVRGVVYQTSNDGRIYALDAKTGTKRWDFPTQGGTVWASPAVVGGTLYQAAGDGSVYAVDTATGQERWHYPTAGVAGSSVVVSGGLAYVGSQDGRIFALDAGNGAKHWEQRTGAEGGSPSLAHGILYVGSADGHLYALDAKTGQQVWRSPTDGYAWASPTIVGGTVFVGTGEGMLHAFSAASGVEKWRKSLGANIESLAVANGIVFASSFDGKLTAFEAAGGATKWTFSAARGWMSAPAVACGVVYVNSGGGTLYAVDASTGRVHPGPVAMDPCKIMALDPCDDMVGLAGELLGAGAVPSCCISGTTASQAIAAGTKTLRLAHEGAAAASCVKPLAALAQDTLAQFSVAALTRGGQVVTAVVEETGGANVASIRYFTDEAATIQQELTVLLTPPADKPVPSQYQPVVTLETEDGHRHDGVESVAITLEQGDVPEGMVPVALYWEGQEWKELEVGDHMTSPDGEGAEGADDFRGRVEATGSALVITADHTSSYVLAYKRSVAGAGDASAVKESPSLTALGLLVLVGLFALAMRRRA